MPKELSELKAAVATTGGAPPVTPAFNVPIQAPIEVSVAPQAAGTAYSGGDVTQEDFVESGDELSISPLREEWEVSDVQNDTEASDKGECGLGEAAGAPPFVIPEKEDCLLPEEAREFWVLQGEAAPREFRAISKVQRKINAEVHKRCGFFMPYAPRWVYQHVEAQLQEWVDLDILQYLQLDSKSLQQPDSAARQQAQDQVKGCLTRWWMGRTVLQHHVRSVYKRAPERCLSTDVVGFNGIKLVKPHRLTTCPTRLPKDGSSLKGG
ncbi:hypothetical protein XELAEV_18012045mg [Xenopus laevis]|uniref:Uncharacterized protein n=1 Tax=Xenopus laevis TaxID=8355 RepID=A0A974DM21_XENLA|nr:hypothetical protein XELAEV_18012045mg [Xenopus laevis]